MTRRRAHFRARADADLREIARWIAGRSGNLDMARSFIAKLRDKCDDLASLPGQLGRQREDLGDGLRSIPWRDYVIVFRYAGEGVEIVRILHGARYIPALMAREPEG